MPTGMSSAKATPPHRAVGAGPQDGPQLRAKHRQVLQAQADRAAAQKRVGLVRGRQAQVHRVGHLVGPQVERTKREGPTAQQADGLGVQAVLLFFVGLVVRRQVDELGAVEPDAQGALLQRVGHLVRKLDVPAQLDLDAVTGDRRLIAQLRQLGGLLLEPPDLFAVLQQLACARLRDNHAPVAVRERGWRCDWCVRPDQWPGP